MAKLSRDNIDKNMLRDRAVKLPEITDKMWETINDENKWIVKEFFDCKAELSPATIKQYASGIRQFFWFVKMNCDNKPVHKIKKREFSKYMGFLISHGLSSSALRFKKASVSTLCNFIESDFSEDDDYKEYSTFRNFTKITQKIQPNVVYEKKVITTEEYQLVMDYLEEREDYLEMAYLATLFHVGGRRGGLRQFKAEWLDYEHEKNKKGEEQSYIISGTVREKGFGIDGSPKKYMINDDAVKYMRLWCDKRGYENEFVFTLGKAPGHQISLAWADDLCERIISPLLSRRVVPHNFKASIITRKLEEGHDMKVVSKYIGLHKNSAVTSAHYDLRSDDDERDALM